MTSDKDLTRCLSELDQAKASLREAVKAFGPARINALCDVMIDFMNDGEPRVALAAASSLGPDVAHLAAFAAVIAFREELLAVLLSQGEEDAPGGA